jgi:hypothetical protein
MQGKALDGRQTFRFFVYGLNITYFMYLKQYKHVLDEYDLRNQQNPPFSKLHIELLEQFEGSRTFTNFTEFLLSKNRTEQPWFETTRPAHFILNRSAGTTQ